jgi:Flp pilus assembly protein TadD
LEGPPGNPHAIGAVIELQSDGGTQRRYIHPTRSYLSQTEPIATFGLGPSAGVDALTVTWPDGTKQPVQVDSVDRVLTVRQTTTKTAADPAVTMARYSTLANTAKAQLENGEFEKAVATLKAALDLQPDSAAMRRNLVRAYTLSGQPALAVEELKRLQASSPTPSAAIEYLSGLAAARQLRNEDAAEHFRKAIELDPNDSTLRYQYGLALTALGQADEARQQFEKAAELDPLHGGAQYQLATIARKAGDQQAFARYMRDFQRIRGIKGAADPLALEENRYTKAEPPETAARAAPLVAGPNARFVFAATSGTDDAGPTSLAGFAVLSMDDAGRYQIAAVTSDGFPLVLSYDPSTGFTELARSGQSIGQVGERATVLVGNAFVDASARTTAGPADEETSRQGDQPEIAIVTPQKTWLVRYQPEGGFDDLSAASNLSAAAGDTARWVDLDHDGDIDLCTASESGLRVWRNHSDGGFVEATDEFGLAEVPASTDFAAADFEATNLGVDLVVAGSAGSSLYRNQFAGRLTRATPSGGDWPAAERVLADDFNNDGVPDVVFVSPSAATLVITNEDQRQQLVHGLEVVDASTTIDVDNDGWLDVVVASRAGSAAKLVLLRNVGGRFDDAPEPLPSPAPARRSGLLDADLDGDGRTDLAILGTDGRLAVLRNETPTDNRQLKLTLRSFVGSPSSIGVRVQVRSGEHVVTRWTSRELPIEIGMGQHAQADSIQTLWMNGIARNEIDVALTGEPVRITIVEFVRSSSCPFLYAFADGAWEFITDLLGGAPLNVSAARGVPLPLDPDEVVVLGPAERFAEGKAAARLRLTSELREVVYLDHVQLLAVDHPADVSIFSRDRVASTPVAGKRVIAGRNPVAPRLAIGSDGIDRTAVLAKEDGAFAPPGRVLPPPAVGFTEPLAIELEFDAVDHNRTHLLALTGWFRFGNSSTNIAASQRGDLRVIWPRLEALDSDGNWQVVEEMVGFPAGNTKTIVCDLTGKLPAGTRRLRLTTSFEVRWDRIAIYESVPVSELRITELPPVIADLSWHGFAELRPHASDRPQVPNLARISNAPPWLTAVEGWCTRYGDIRPLVADADPMMAILNSGDGATIEFTANSLPERQSGMERTLLLYTRGWIKEADSNTLPNRRVEPLPGTNDAEIEPSDDWQLEYNTRWVPANWTQH